MKANELRQMSDQELENALSENKMKLFSLKVNNKLSSSLGKGGFSVLRRLIARIITVLHERGRLYN